MASYQSRKTVKHTLKWKYQIVLVKIEVFCGEKRRFECVRGVKKKERDKISQRLRDSQSDWSF